MKVYLAGKITGDPNYREKFAAAAKKLEERAGVTVISPAVTPEGLKKVDYMRICFAMLESADAVVFLPDWEDSPGAQLEKHWCEYVGEKDGVSDGGCGMIDFEGYYLCATRSGCVHRNEERRRGRAIWAVLGPDRRERAGRVVQNRGGAKSRLYEARTADRERETTGCGGHLVSPAVD